MADVFYLAVGSAGAAVVTSLVAGAGTQIASDHRAAIAKVWRRVWRAGWRWVGTWVRYLSTELAPVLPALAARPHLPRWLRLPRRRSRAARVAHKHRSAGHPKYLAHRPFRATTTIPGGNR